MIKIKMLVVLVVIFILLGGPAYSFAETANTTSSTAISSQVQTLLDQIKLLQAKIATLKTAQEQVAIAQTDINKTFTLIRSLKQGISGDDVKALQVVLASDTTIYPEGMITGYYGRLTSEAVKRFQKKFGIDAVGNVGPKTLQKLNEEIGKLSLSSEDDEDDSDSDGDKKDKKFCVSPGHLIAPGWLKKNKGEKQSVSECQNLPSGISKKLDDDNEHGDEGSNKDKLAPVISGISTSYTILLNGATSTINWITNEPATGKIWYGTATPLMLSFPTLSVNSGKFELNHRFVLSGLATSTTYYFILESRDNSGNTSTTTQNSFAIPVN